MNAHTPMGARALADAVPLVRGSGGSSKGGAAPNAPNTLRSRARAKFIEAISEGPIWGLVDGERSIFFDQTPIRNADGTYNFKDVIWEDRKGNPDDAHFTGHSAVETPFDVEVQVKNANGPTQRTIVDQNADAVRLILRIPALFRADEETGAMLPASLSYAIDVRAYGGEWQEMVVKHWFNQKTTSPFQVAHRIDLPFQGSPWDVRVRRLTADSPTDKLQNELYWESYITLVEGKFTYPFTAAVGIEVNAEDLGSSIPARSYHVKGLLINVPSNYDPETRIYSGIWDGTFKIAWTNNPAWVFYDLIVNDRYGLGEFISAAIVDKWSLYTIAQYCDQLVPSGYKNGDTQDDIYEPRFTFNGVINSRDDAFSVLQSITKVWRGMGYWSLGQLFATADMPADPVKVISPANIIGGEITYSGTAMKARHSVVVVSWNDPNDFFRPSKEVVINQQMLNRFGWREKSLQLTGCTSRGLAHRYGKWVLDTEQNETETAEYQASWDHADVRPGDIIADANPHRARVRLGGRIVSHRGLRVELDHDFEPGEGHTYKLKLTMPDGALVTRDIASFLDGRNLLLADPFPAEALPNAMFAITGTDITPPLFRVIAREEVEPNIFKISALQHDPQKFDRIERGIVFEPLPVSRPSTTVPAPTNLSVRETGYVTNGQSYHSLLLSWTPPIDVVTRGFLVSADTPEGQHIVLGTVQGSSLELSNTLSGEYKFYVQTINFTGVVSDPAEFVFEAAGPLGFAPPVVTDLRLTEHPTASEFAGRDLRVTWHNLFANSTDATSEGGAPAHVVSPNYSHNVVSVYHGGTGELLRQVTVRAEEFLYDYGSNTLDNDALGRAYPSRSIRIDVQAFDVFGRSSAVVSRVFSNPVPMAIVPSYNVVGSTIFLSYSKVPDPDFEGILLWRSTTPGTINVLTDAPYYDGANNPLTISGEPETGYYFRIAAYDGFGPVDLNYSTEFTITTLSEGADLDPPAVPTGLAATSALLSNGRARVGVTWNANTEDDLAGYDLEVRQSGGAYVAFPTTTNRYEFDGLPGIVYQMRLRARDKAGNASNFTAVLNHTAFKDEVAPAAVTAVSVQPGLTSLWLTWTNPADADFAHVEVWEGASAQQSSATLIGTTSSGSFPRTGLGHNVQRFYFLRAVDTSGNKSGFVTASGTTAQMTAPTRLSINGLVLTPNSPDENRVAWPTFSITYGEPGLAPTTRVVAAGNALWTANSLHLFYVEGETVLRASTNVADVFTNRGYLIGIYRGGTDVQLAEGKAMIDGANVLAGTVGANQLVANDAIITNTLQLANGIITDAKIESLDASKLKANSVLADTIQVGGSTLGDIREWASDPAAQVNAGVTAIAPGRILIGGTTTLSNWISGSDVTKIDGGSIAANSIAANAVTIGMRGLTLEGIEFEHNKPAVNDVAWTAGTIFYTDDTGANASAAIAAGSVSWTAGIVYIYWTQGAAALSTTTSFATANAANNVILATYRGAAWLFASYGRTVIDGGQIKAQSIDAAQLKAGSITAQMLSVTSLSSLSANLGTVTAGRIMSADGSVDFNLDEKYLDFWSMPPGTGA
ncbi:TipJ family phage tail tip protein [Ancylobacter rudongensis]|uniref:Phage-related protein, tail component n=1 Tax=Ancylobacter rudongensis TaxID=177413 RepID=A0A1G4UPT9_9HYPH|nr:phage tail protein [Ancylobacter rudongensis]SCW95676.1 Phage-related protein, tail component [Ancylobacter rudongensis]